MWHQVMRTVIRNNAEILIHQEKIKRKSKTIKKHISLWFFFFDPPFFFNGGILHIEPISTKGEEKDEPI